MINCEECSLPAPSLQGYQVGRIVRTHRNGSKTEEPIIIEICEKCRSSKPDAPFKALEKTGRNDPCPCRSGRKFKKCHGI